jgi:hypothetical protein
MKPLAASGVQGYAFGERSAGLTVLRREAAMSNSETIRWVVAAAVITALGTPAGGADLSPPLATRHLPHGPLRIVQPGHLPRASTNSPSGERAEREIPGWGANSNLGPSIAFPTGPSGVIGGTQFDPDYQFSPNWLSGIEGS